MTNHIVDHYTRNDCYVAGVRLGTLKGYIVHSTATKGVLAPAWKRRWNVPNIKKMVHGFIDDQNIIDTLPTHVRAWHIATTEGNSHYIGYEMCEDLNWDKEYFLKTYANTVEKYASMLRRDKMPVSSILSHREAHTSGFASNHGDPDHWWSNFGYNMDMFRRDVAKALTLEEVDMSKNFIDVDGSWGDETTRALQRLQGTTVDGEISEPYSSLMASIQRDLKVPVNGKRDIVTIKAMQARMGMPAHWVDGYISKPKSSFVMEMQRRINLGTLSFKVASAPVTPVPVPTPPIELPTGQAYRVVSGPFKYEGDAKDLQKKLTDLGFASFLTLVKS